MSSYSINLHAHSLFSDGYNTPLAMAIEAKRLGFCALVLTDHFYGNDREKSIRKDTLLSYKRAIEEAKTILSIIVGLEVPIAGEEVVVFGGEAKKMILEHEMPMTISDLRRLRSTSDCAIILAHPRDKFEMFSSVIDGFEEYNSGYGFFESRGFGDLAGLPRFCNSDAHSTGQLKIAWNVTNTKINNEAKLIRYIRRGLQPNFVLIKSLEGE